MITRRLGAAYLFTGAIFLAFLMPALFNGHPILYPDSVGYFHAGYAALQHFHFFHPDGQSVQSTQPITALAVQSRDGITTARSAYYGALYAITYAVAGEWGLPIIQVVVVFGAIKLAVRRLFNFGATQKALLTLGLVSLTGLAVFSVTIMPDVFAGLLLLAVAMVIAYSPSLPLWEYSFWITLAFVSCIFHKSHLAILVLITLAILPFYWRRRRYDLLALVAVALLAAGAHLIVDVSIKHLTGHWPTGVPFGLARMVGDGTAERYLAAECPSRHYVTCQYLPEMPMTEIQFLWGHQPGKSVLGPASPDVRRQITNEAADIEMGTVARFPIAQIVRSLQNSLCQFFDVGITEFALTPTGDFAAIPAYRPALEAYTSSAISTGRMPLRAISLVMTVVFYMSLAGVGLLMWRALRRHDHSPSLHFATILLTGLAINAVVCGAVSGVFDRYQGRVLWLAPMALIALWATLQKTSP